MGLRIVSPAQEHVIALATFSDRFRRFCEGDPVRIRAMVSGVADAQGGRVALAFDGTTVVGFLCLLPPMPGDRFHGLEQVIELAADEDVEDGAMFGELFAAATAGDLDDMIVYDIVDPALRLEGESARAYRRRVQDVLAMYGFVPLPTDAPQAHLRRDSVLMARFGSRVSPQRMEWFLSRLHDRRSGVRRPPKVAIALHNRDLRNMVRQDLEIQGVPVVAVSSGTDDVTLDGADVLVTEPGGPSARITVRVVDDDEIRWDGDELSLPMTDLDRLVDILRTGSRWWDRSSSTAS